MRRDETFLYDKRLHEKHLASKIITKKELDKHLKNLPDVSKKADFLEMEEASDNKKTNPDEAVSNLKN